MALGFNAYAQSSLDTVKRNKVLTLLKEDQYTQAFVILKDIQNRYDNAEPGRDYAQLLLEISYIFDEKGNYQSSLEYSFATLNLASVRPEFKMEEAKALIEIASIYYFLEQPSIGLGYSKKGLTLAYQLSENSLIAQCLNSMGTLYDKMGDDKKAINCYDSALLLRNQLNISRDIAATLSNIGLLYEKQGQFEKALSFQLKSLAIDDSIRNEYGITWSYQMLGALTFKMQNFNAAERYLEMADSLAHIINSYGVLIDNYRSKKELMKVKGDYKEALRYAELFDKLRDSIYSRELMSTVSVVQNTYELNRKNQELKDKQNTVRQQRNFIIVVAITLVFVSILAFFYYRSFTKVRKLNWEIAEQNEEIRMQSEELTEANAILVELNRAVEEQKEEIQAQSEELTESNQTIYQINQNLEETIKVRTNELVQAYKELDTFFYRASHDFRRPLTTFMGLAEVAKITVKDEYVLGLFDKVRLTANSLDKMLTKLQSISDVGLQHLSPKEVYVKDIFDSVFTTYYESLREEEMKLNAEVLLSTSFHSYPSLLKVVLDNLVENSIHFKRPGSNGLVNLKAYEQGNEIVLEVRDNGQGIEEQYQDRIFDMYFRGNERSKGNGLGLYIVKKAAEKIKGRITFQSTYDSGSVFSVFLPRDIV